jgi:integrase/recombinase XerD
MARPLTTQVFESTSLRPCNFLSQKVSGPHAWRNGGQAGLYSTSGERKYLNRDERHRLLANLETLEPKKCLFALLLAWTGARVSEVLALTPNSFQVDAGIVTIETLKQCAYCVREIPIPPKLMQRLERFFGLRGLQCGPLASKRLWRFCRQTAWRFIKRACVSVQIAGRRASPRGLRHAFGVRAMQRSVPMPLAQRWMGHARLTTTAIYMSVCGPEEIAFAEQFWREEPIKPQTPPSQPAFAKAA